MNNIELEQHLQTLLQPGCIKDYAPNGLQVEGKSEINKVVTGVTACQALIDRAIQQQADAILVHHGYFWPGEPQVLRGMKYRRIKALLDHNINLYAYHLPLDVHSTLGNNVLLGKALGIELKGGMEPNTPSIPVWGELEQPLSVADFSQRIAQVLQREPLVIEAGTHQIKRIGWCTGAAQDYINLAADLKLDAFLSGEISERTTFAAREQQVHYFAAGHHATERFGIQALGEWLQAQHGLEVEFIDIDNPV